MQTGTANFVNFTGAVNIGIFAFVLGADISGAFCRVAVEAAHMGNRGSVATSDGADRIIVYHLAGLDLGATTRAWAGIFGDDGSHSWLAILTIAHFKTPNLRPPFPAVPGYGTMRQSRGSCDPLAA